MEGREFRTRYSVHSKALKMFNPALPTYVPTYVRSINLVGQLTGQMAGKCPVTMSTVGTFQCCVADAASLLP